MTIAAENELEVVIEAVEDKAQVKDQADKIAAEAKAATPPSTDPVVEVIDDTPPKDRGRPRRPEGQEPDIPTDEEIASYGENVQKRIKRLKFEYHEERRQKEERERIAAEATHFASAMLAENEALKSRLGQGENVLAGQAKARVESEIALAKDVMQKAFELGDSKALAEAQEALARLAAEAREIDSFIPNKPRPMQSQQPPPYVAPKPDYEAVEWAKKNPWFMRDQHMTTYAYVVEDRLKARGSDPRSPEHYKAIDEAVRKEFPEAFMSEQPSGVGSTASKKPAIVVAPSSRVNSASPRKVLLTASQVALAKRLGISPEGYARRMIELEQEGKQ